MGRKTYYLDRFISKIRFTNTCWIWEGHIQPDGYGVFAIMSKKISAHRLSYLEFVGEIPEGKVLDHLCRNHACVNPSHLEAVTQTVNLMRGETMNVLNKQKTHCPQGHEFTESNTYTRKNGWRDCKTCKRIAVNKYATKQRSLKQ